MNALIEHISQHLATYGVGGGVLIVAAISCMPEKIPFSAQECWTWLRASLQTAIPARTSHPTLPDSNPAQQQPKQ